MKLKTLLFILFFITFRLISQVGIGTNYPNATLEVVGKATNTSSMDGIIPPRLTGEQLQSKTYGTNQNGAIVFVTQLAATPSGQASNVGAIGLYVFHAASNKWVALSPNSSHINNVYCDSNDPNIATKFDVNFPAVAHNTALIQNNQYSYFGQDGSIWIWNGTIYISYNKSVNLNVGQRTTIFRTMNNSEANGTVITTTGLIELDGIVRIDFKKYDNSYYSPRIVNISGASIDLTYQTFSTIFSHNEQFIKGAIANNTAVDVDYDNLVAWTNALNEVVKTNLILPNGKWYEIEWFAYEFNSLKYVYMSALRKF